MKKIEKPWGFEEIVEINDKYMVKKLTMYKDHRCSLQFHRQKRETIYVLSGVLKIISGLSENALQEKLYYPGDSITIAPGLIHRMYGQEHSVYLEASTPEIDDVVRISDDFNRS